jgi:hypothetical protein
LLKSSERFFTLTKETTANRFHTCQFKTFHIVDKRISFPAILI